LSQEISIQRSYLDSQLEFMNCTQRELMFSGAFGAGKTYIGCEKIKFLTQYYPGNRCLIVRKAFNTLETSTLWTLLRGKNELPPVLPSELIINHHKTKHIIEVRTSVPEKPSFIFYAGLDDPDRLGSFAELGAVFVDEGIEIDELDWIQLSGRLRHDVPFKQIFTATNPGTPAHFLYKKFYNQITDDPLREDKIHCIESNTLDNIYLPKDYIDLMQGFTGQYYQRYVLGKWMSFSGQIYEQYNKKHHVCPPFKPPGHWIKWRSVDFGFVHPFVMQWWTEAAEDYWIDYRNVNDEPAKWYIPKDSFIMYREIYHTGLLVEDAGKWAVRESQDENVAYTVRDWDAEGGETLNRLGIKTTPANKDVETGIQYLYDLMRANTDLIIPSPMVYWCRDARCHPADPVLIDKKKPTCTAEEIGLYRRVGTGKNAEMPLKEDDDGCDASRYAVVSRKNKSNEPIIVRATII